MAIVSLKAKVLYFIWKKRGFKANYNDLARALGYQDERRIRDVVNEALQDGTLEVRKRNGSDYWAATNKAEGTIGLFILPLTQIIVVAVLGAVVLVAGLEETLGDQIPPLSLAGLGVVIIAICFVFWYLQRRQESKLWELDRRRSADRGT